MKDWQFLLGLLFFAGVALVVKGFFAATINETTDRMDAYVLKPDFEVSDSHLSEFCSAVLEEKNEFYSLETQNVSNSTGDLKKIQLFVVCRNEEKKLQGFVLSEKVFS